MMGQLPRMESLYYYFHLEDQIPEGHLLRLIDRYVDLRFVRDRLKSLYRSTGHPLGSATNQVRRITIPQFSARVVGENAFAERCLNTPRNKPSVHEFTDAETDVVALPDLRRHGSRCGVIN